MKSCILILCTIFSTSLFAQVTDVQKYDASSNYSLVKAAKDACLLTLAEKPDASNNWDTVLKLIKERAEWAGKDFDINDPLTKGVLKAIATPMDMTSVQNAKKSYIGKVIEAYVNAKDPDGRNSLMYASLAGQGSVAKELITNGAKIEETCLEGKNAFVYASMNGTYDNLRTLLLLTRSLKDKYKYSSDIYAEVCSVVRQRDIYNNSAVVYASIIDNRNMDVIARAVYRACTPLPFELKKAFFSAANKVIDIYGRNIEKIDISTLEDLGGIAYSKRETMLKYKLLEDNKIGSDPIVGFLSEPDRYAGSIIKP